VILFNMSVSFTVESAQAEADRFYYEDHINVSGWEICDHTSEGINYLVSKKYLQTKDGAEVFVNKCNMVVKGATVQALLDRYMTQQGDWDFGSTSNVQILEQNGNRQTVYLQHKVLSAASVKKDCVIERNQVLSPGSAKVYATSVNHKSRPDKYEGYARSFLLFHGCYIVEKQQGLIDFTFVHCYDFNGWVHDKFVIAEKSKTAARMCKLVKGTKGAVLTTPSTPLVLKAGSSQQQQVKSTSGITTSNYAEYHNLIRDAQPAFMPEPSNPHQMPPPQHLQYPAPSVGYNFCPGCGNPSKGMKFCAGCGYKLF